MRLRREKNLYRGRENGKEPSVFGDLGEVCGVLEHVNMDGD